MASIIRGSFEFIPGRLYYVALRNGVPENATQMAHFWSVHVVYFAWIPTLLAEEFKYWSFFLDWGPLSLGNVYKFCQALNSKLRSDKLRGKVIYFWSGTHAHKRANAAFLLSAWQLLYRGKSPEEAYLPFRDITPPLPFFHDASPCICTYELSIPDCLRGLGMACHHRFFNFETFNVEEYEYYEQVESGDLNWIVDGKFLAFAGPHSRSEMTKEGYRTLTPANYIPYFKRHNVTLVVRLNQRYYDETSFLNAGIAHQEAYFLDGTVPPPHVLYKFIADCEATSGAVAVHCKAGLGRTGTCIGCYLMKHYNMTAAEAIGWMRICRPGSVIGPQQQFLQEMESTMHREGMAFRDKRKKSGSMSEITHISDPLNSRIPPTRPGHREAVQDSPSLPWSQQDSAWRIGITPIEETAVSQPGTSMAREMVAYNSRREHGQLARHSSFSAQDAELIEQEKTMKSPPRSWRITSERSNPNRNGKSSSPSHASSRSLTPTVPTRLIEHPSVCRRLNPQREVHRDDFSNATAGVAVTGGVQGSLGRNTNANVRRISKELTRMSLGGEGGRGDPGTAGARYGNRHASRASAPLALESKRGGGRTNEVSAEALATRRSELGRAHAKGKPLAASTQGVVTPDSRCEAKATPQISVSTSARRRSYLNTCDELEYSPGVSQGDLLLQRKISCRSLRQ